MDVTNLILYLKGKITDQTLDQQMVSKAIRLLELGAVFTAQSFGALPAPAGRSGQLWYVVYDGLYWSNGEYWISFGKPNYQIIWSWGNNNVGQLGDVSLINKSSPVSILNTINDWCQVAAGDTHSLALGCANRAWAWGNNGSGRLGDNTTVNKSSPVSVVGGFTDWCRISGGNSHSVAVRTNGTAWAWGLNSSGQIGDNTTTSRLSPVSVVGGFTNWCGVSAGTSHSLGVRVSGSAWSWGSNSVGQLGDGTTTTRLSPVSVVGGFTDWCQVSTFHLHSVAIRTSGTLWSWGNNGSCQMGDSSATNRSSPVSVVGGFTDWFQTSAGGFHTLAVRSVGCAWAWGAGGYGQLGDDAFSNRSSPVAVVGGFTNWCQMSAAYCHSLAIRTNGTAWAWGANTLGRLGDNTTTPRTSPVSLAGGFSDWCSLGGGRLAIRSITP